MSDALESCTSDPFSNIFERNGVKYEFIDTAGNSDSNDKDEQNFTNLVTFLKDKKEIDFIFLLLKFGERITGETKKYINRLNRIFEENDFYTHLSIIFTKYPEKPKKKEEKLKDNLKEQINTILEETFNIKKEQELPEVKVYFLDTDIDEDTNEYIEKFQNTIDIMLEQIKLNIDLFGSIDTSNLDSNGEFVKKRREYLKQKYEEFKKNFKKEKQEKEQLQNEIKDSNLDENTMERKKCVLRELEEKEQKQRENYKNIEEEIKKRQTEIDNKAKGAGVILEALKESKVARIAFFGSYFLYYGWSITTLFGSSVGIGIPLVVISLLGGIYSSYLIDFPQRII